MVHYTMTYYSVIKNKNIMSFSGKWMELDNIILSEVTQTQKDMHSMSSLVTGYTSKSTEYLGYYLQNFRSLTTKIPSEDTSIPLKRVMKIIMGNRGREEPRWRWGD